MTAVLTTNRLLAVLPLILPIYMILSLSSPIIDSIVKGVLLNDDNETLPPHSSPTKHKMILELWIDLIMAGIGYFLTCHLIPTISTYMLHKNIFGKDLGKRGTVLAEKRIPEALGMVPGSIFLVCLILRLVVRVETIITTTTTVLNTAATTMQDPNQNQLLEINAALLSVCFMLFLGFTDDVLDWPWRYKLVLPTIASLPLLCCYNGSTTIVVPIQLRTLLWKDGSTTGLGDLLGLLITIDTQAHGSLVDLGYFYLLYMGLLAVFCTNAINIYAGINGLEVGQSYIIGTSILVHNLMELSHQRLVHNHLFSAMTMFCFVGVSLGLLKYNWYPSQVFVGDTYCYFAGMTFAVVGILGHFSKTLLLFFIPQVVNFLYSAPQLFKLVPCPRHRLPRYNPKTARMEPSTFDCQPHQYRWLKVHPDDTHVPNMTVINLFLRIVGPLREKHLCLGLLILQVVCNGFGFFVRYYLAGFFFER